MKYTAMILHRLLGCFALALIVIFLNDELLLRISLFIADLF